MTDLPKVFQVIIPEICRSKITFVIQQHKLFVSALRSEVQE